MGLLLAPTRWRHARRILGAGLALVLAGALIIWAGRESPDAARPETAADEFASPVRTGTRGAGGANRSEAAIGENVREAEPVGEQGLCGDLPFPGGLIKEWHLTSCWNLYGVEVDGKNFEIDLVLGGTARGDRSRGVLVVEALDGAEEIELPKGTEYVYVHAVNSRAACFTTGDSREWEVTFADMTLSPPGETPHCGPAPTYEVGKGFPVDCRDSPEVSDNYRREDFPRFQVHDCWAVAVTEHILVWYHGGWSEGFGAIINAWSGRDHPSWRAPFRSREFPDATDLTITYADLRWVCFELNGTGGLAIDREQSEVIDGAMTQAAMLKDVSGTPCEL